MYCPVCDKPMVVLELNEVEIDYCTTCAGIWLDAGELELLLNDKKERNDFIVSFKIDEHSKEKKRKCPLCRKRMEKVLYGTDRFVRLDRCKKGEGLWLDKGELETIFEIGEFDKQNKVYDLLIDMFGKTK